MLKNNKKNLLLSLSIAGIAICLYLVYTKITSNPLVCGFGNCEKVQNSPYAVFLGIPLGYWGLIYYFALFTLVYKNYKKLIGFAAVWGIVFSIYLLSLEIFIIKEICMWCTLSFVNIVIINLLHFFVKERQT
jgi:uncharacterized membrane protein